jgi:lipoprotein LprA
MVRICAAVACLLIAACSVGAAPANPATVLRDAGKAMGQLKTVAADIKVTKGVVTVDNFRLASASTKMRLPADSDTSIKVMQSDFLVDIRLVTLNGHYYAKLPFYGFAELTPQQASQFPDISRIFDPARGMPVVIPQGQKPKLDGTEKLDGVDTDRVVTTFTPDQISQMLGLKPAGEIATTLWIGQKDRLILKVVLTGLLSQTDKPATIEVHLKDFNNPVDIQDPTRATA